MNILFLTMASGMETVEKSGIYTDLMRKFRDEGHEVYIVFPNERRSQQGTRLTHHGQVHSLGVKTLNLTKTNVIEKGIGQVLLEYQYVSAILRYLSAISFDIILYSTPPITFTKVIREMKKKNPQAISYLLLKDIFPQNAIDLGLLKRTGVKGILYRFFRRKEKQLYQLSDYIGCMSPANVQYVLANNPEVDASKVEVAPNSCEILPKISVLDKEETKSSIRRKYGLPAGVPIFIYGGNMGKPQGIPFLIECLKAVKDRTDCHFVVVGDGTEYSKLESFMVECSPKAVSVFCRLPKEEYDKLTSVCDVGLIFLDYRFTIPNYPSRLLSYLMESKPIIATTDPNCDMGRIAEENGYGMYCPSNSVSKFMQVVDKMLDSDIHKMGENGYNFFLQNYTVQQTYDAIMQHLKA